MILVRLSGNKFFDEDLVSHLVELMIISVVEFRKLQPCQIINLGSNLYSKHTLDFFADIQAGIRWIKLYCKICQPLTKIRGTTTSI